MSVLSDPHFHDEAGPIGSLKRASSHMTHVCLHGEETKRNNAMKGNSTRIGTYECYDCRKPFTVDVGIVFESSHVGIQLKVVEAGEIYFGK